MEALTVKIGEIAVLVIAVIYAVVFHEVAHGYAAYGLGDPTPKEQKRLTLNPIRHLSFWGSLVVPLAGILILGFAFGWAKPVRIEPKNLKRPWRDMAIIGLAGPLTNFAAAVVSAGLFRLLVWLAPDSSNHLLAFPLSILVFFSFINIFLGLFNLIPLPPLDGGHVLLAVLPEKIRMQIYLMTPFFLILLMLFFFTGGLKDLLALAKFLHHFIAGVGI